MVQKSKAAASQLLQIKRLDMLVESAAEKDK